MLLLDPRSPIPPIPDPYAPLFRIPSVALWLCSLNRLGSAGDQNLCEVMVMGKANRFSPEVRERAVRLVGEQAGEAESQWTTIRSVAAKIGCSAETLRSWIRQTERDRGERSGLTTSEREELKVLQRENRELKKANEILRLASAYFAKAELDRKQR